jgi:TolB-like protein
MLRSDPETDFLAFSLPDAIAVSLAGLSSLVVRSSLAAARFAGAVLDLREIAKKVDVDTVLTGTLLRAGTQLRLTTQLVEAPSGTLIWSKASQVELRDIFQLQDTEYFCGARNLETSRALNPSLLTFEAWLAENKNRIPLE